MLLYPVSFIHQVAGHAVNRQVLNWGQQLLRSFVLLSIHHIIQAAQLLLSLLQQKSGKNGGFGRASMQ